jgi:cytochrome c oxidase subunit I+III
VVGLASDTREVLITRVMDAEPDHKKEFPTHSIWPFWTAVSVSVLFIWSIFSPWGVVWGAIPVTIFMILWFWPRKGIPPAEMERRIATGHIVPPEPAV